MTCECVCWYKQSWGTAGLGLRSCLLIPPLGAPFLNLDTLDISWNRKLCSVEAPSIVGCLAAIHWMTGAFPWLRGDNQECL